MLLYELDCWALTEEKTEEMRWQKAFSQSVNGTNITQKKLNNIRQYNIRIWKQIHC